MLVREISAKSGVTARNGCLVLFVA